MVGILSSGASCVSNSDCRDPEYPICGGPINNRVCKKQVSVDLSGLEKFGTAIGIYFGLAVLALALSFKWKILTPWWVDTSDYGVPNLLDNPWEFIFWLFPKILGLMLWLPLIVCRVLGKCKVEESSTNQRSPASSVNSSGLVRGSGPSFNTNNYPVTGSSNSVNYSGGRLKNLSKNYKSFLKKSKKIYKTRKLRKSRNKKKNNGLKKRLFYK